MHREILADLETPLSAFRKIAPEGDAALLESMEGGETWGRFSIIGCDPEQRFECRGTTATLTRDGQVERFEEERPLGVLDRILRDERAARLSELPAPAGGAIGFVAYDAVRRLERLPEIARDDLGLPDARFVLFRSAVLFDHRSHTVRLVTHAVPGRDPDAAWRAAAERLDRLESDLRRPAPAPSARPAQSSPIVRSSMTPEQFRAAVERAREYIRAGDVVQVVLAHRLEIDHPGDPFDVYRALRVINPSPYLFFLRMGELSLVGSSPEVLVRRTEERVETRPIAGTRGRGADPEADRAL